MVTRAIAVEPGAERRPLLEQDFEISQSMAFNLNLWGTVAGGLHWYLRARATRPCRALELPAVCCTAAGLCWPASTSPSVATELKVITDHCSWGEAGESHCYQLRHREAVRMHGLGERLVARRLGGSRVLGFRVIPYNVHVS